MPTTSGSLASQYLRRRRTAWLVLAIAVLGYLVALITLPNFGNCATRHEYESFFTTAAPVAAGIFVALAVASREVNSDVALGIITVLLVGTATLAAVLALLPHTSTLFYSVMFIVLVGGGLAGLMSTVLIAAAALSTARADRQEQTLGELQEALNEIRKGGSQG